MGEEKIATIFMEKSQLSIEFFGPEKEILHCVSAFVSAAKLRGFSEERILRAIAVGLSGKNTTAIEIPFFSAGGETDGK